MNSIRGILAEDVTAVMNDTLMQCQNNSECCTSICDYILNILSSQHSTCIYGNRIPLGKSVLKHQRLGALTPLVEILRTLVTEAPQCAPRIANTMCRVLNSKCDSAIIEALLSIAPSVISLMDEGEI
jgi:hypothetical protein